MNAQGAPLQGWGCSYLHQGGGGLPGLEKENVRHTVKFECQVNKKLSFSINMYVMG